MNTNNFQRPGALSNAHAGNEFEELVRDHFKNQGLSLVRGFKVPVGVGQTKKLPGLGFSLTVSKNVPLKYRNMCVVHGNGNPIIVTTILEEMLMEEAVRLGQKSLH